MLFKLLLLNFTIAFICFILGYSYSLQHEILVLIGLISWIVFGLIVNYKLLLGDDT